MKLLQPSSYYMYGFGLVDKQEYTASIDKPLPIKTASYDGQEPFGFDKQRWRSRASLTSLSQTMFGNKNAKQSMPELRKKVVFRHLHCDRN